MPKIVASGLGPSILEYIDMLTMSAITAQFGLELGIPEDVKRRRSPTSSSCMESGHDDRLDEDVHAVAELLVELGAIDVYVLPPQARPRSSSTPARRRSGWPRPTAPTTSSTSSCLARVDPRLHGNGSSDRSTRHGAWIAGCGHAGDGNVHLAVFQKDPEVALDS